MKTKCEIIDKAKFSNWIITSNVFAKSEIPSAEALRQYKFLSISQRIAIQKSMQQRDEIRKHMITEMIDTDAYEISVLVDLNIIATDYDVDPLVIAMCISPPCKINSTIFVK